MAQLTAPEIWDQVVAAAAAPVKPATADRIVDAALRCIGQWGLAKTTLDDVARAAGCSRATVHRIFPGGKDALIHAVAQAEVARLCAAIVDRSEHAGTLEDALAAAITEAGRRIAGHAPLQFLLAHEHEVIVPWLAFRKGAKVLSFVGGLAAPLLSRWLAPEEAQRAGEWAARVVLSFSMCPSATVDLTDDQSVRGLVTTFILPGLQPLMAKPATDGFARPSPSGA